MEQELGNFGDEQRRQLGAKMRRKAIIGCEDETFHPQICLVGQEPASGFILLEKHAQQRDAKTWTDAMAAATGDLPIEVVQPTSDEARALIEHAEADLDAHHCLDLFHVQHEVGKGTSSSIARHVAAAQTVVEDEKQHTERMEASAAIYRSGSEQGICPAAFVEKADGRCAALPDDRVGPPGSLPRQRRSTRCFQRFT